MQEKINKGPVSNKRLPQPHHPSSQSNTNKGAPPPQTPPTWVTMRLKLKLNKH